MITSIFKSQLSYTKYPMANPADWLVGEWWLLDPVVAGRLAYYCYKKGMQLVLTETYRSMDKQKMFYAEYLKYLDTGKLGPHRIKLAAYPGTSWHGIRVAVDGSNTPKGARHPIRNASNIELATFGLCKPISSEPWHIQPIETLHLGSKCIASYEPSDLAPALKRKFTISDATVDFIARYQYASQLVLGLLSGKRKFDKATMKYLMTYKYWDDLQEKLHLELVL